MHTATRQIESPRPPHRFYRWELLVLLCGAFFLHQGDRAIFGVLLSSIQSDLGLSDAQLGMIGTALFVTLACMMPVAGYVGDLWSRKWIVVCSLIFWSSATGVTGMAQGVLWLIAFRSVATAGGESFYAPAAYPLLAAYHQKNALGHVGASSRSVSGLNDERLSGRRDRRSLGLAVGVLRFRRSGDRAGTDLGPPTQGRPHAAAAGPAAAARIGPVEALGVMFRTPTALLLTVGFAAIVLVNNAYVFWAPAFVEEKFDLPAKLAGRDAMLYHHLAALVGVLIGGRVADAFVGRRRQFRLELQSTAMLLGVPAIVGMGLATSLTATWIAMATLGFFRGLYESNTHASLFDVIPPRYRASAVGMLVMLAFLAGSVSPWLLGQCREMFPAGRGLSYGFASLSIAYLIGGLAVLAAVKTTFFRDYCEESPPT